MRKIVIAAAGACVLAAAFGAAETPKATSTSKIEHGKYIVTSVGMCADCHTPHDAQGRIVMEQWLKGAQLPFKPTVPMPWGEVAPPIAGLPTMTEQQAVSYLMTGEKPDQTRTRPPMPPYRMSRADAEAVAAYLKSLP